MRNIKVSYVILGMLCVVTFILKLVSYLDDGCVGPYFSEDICGEKGLIVLGAFGLLGLFGIYLIIIGIKVRSKDKK